MPRPTLALIDADIVTFQAAAGNEATLSFGDDGDALVLDPDLALFRCRERIQDIKEKLKVSEVLLCFSGHNTFRYDALATYKHNRKGKRKPVLLAPLRKHLEAEYPSRCEDRLEADDLLGILTVDATTAIATIDKDLDQIEGLHYNWKHDRVYTLAPRDVLEYTWTQVLTGDSTDGFKGIPRVGPKKAAKILEPVRDDSLDFGQQARVYGLVVEDTYHDAKLSEKYFHSQHACATILRASMWNQETLKVNTGYLTL